MDAERKTLTEEEYEEELNDIYGEVDVCGITFDAGRILLELDPTAFRCGLDNSEITDRIYDTLLQNKQWPQILLDDITSQEVNAKKGTIEIEYMNHKVTIKIESELI